MKTLTDFRKTVETGVDSWLGPLNQIAGGSAPRFNRFTPFVIHVYHFWQTWYPFRVPSIDKWYLFHLLRESELYIFFNNNNGQLTAFP